MKRIYPFFTICLFVILATSCVSRKDVIYFDNGDAELNTVYEKYVPRIKSSDLLSIVISAADVAATQPFNQQSVYQMNNVTAGTVEALNVYMVDEDGYIQYPVLGKIKLGGLTRIEAVELFKNKLKAYIKDPGVNIAFRNFRISVIGEVNKPGQFTLADERVNILEALALAGDISINGIKKNVRVIREEDGQKKIYTIDLTSKKALDSPIYYLRQNDIVYVEPNNGRINATSLGNYSFFVSVAGVIISVMAVLVRK